MWITVAISCRECNSQRVMLTTNKPSEEEIENLEYDCGGMYCIRTSSREIQPDGETIDIGDYE